jgi:hypothetical protein
MVCVSILHLTFSVPIDFLYARCLLIIIVICCYVVHFTISSVTAYTRRTTPVTVFIPTIFYVLEAISFHRHDPMTPQKTQIAV